MAMSLWGLAYDGAATKTSCWTTRVYVSMSVCPAEQLEMGANIYQYIHIYYYLNKQPFAPSCNPAEGQSVRQDPSTS